MTRYIGPPREPLPDLLALIDVFAFTVYPALVLTFVAAVLTVELNRRRRRRRAQARADG